MCKQGLPRLEEQQAIVAHIKGTAVMLMIAGSSSAAVDSYMRALDISVESPATWNSLSMAFIALGQFPLADLADQHDLKSLQEIAGAH